MGLPAANPYAVGVWDTTGNQRNGVVGESVSLTSIANLRRQILSVPFQGRGTVALAQWWWVSSPRAAFPFKSICPWQMVSFGVRRETPGVRPLRHRYGSLDSPRPCSSLFTLHSSLVSYPPVLLAIPCNCVIMKIQMVLSGDGQPHK